MPQPPVSGFNPTLLYILFATYKHFLNTWRFHVASTFLNMMFIASLALLVRAIHAVVGSSQSQDLICALEGETTHLSAEKCGQIMTDYIGL